MLRRLSWIIRGTAIAGRVGRFAVFAIATGGAAIAGWFLAVSSPWRYVLAVSIGLGILAVGFWLIGYSLRLRCETLARSLEGFASEVEADEPKMQLPPWDVAEDETLQKEFVRQRQEHWDSVSRWHNEANAKFQARLSHRVGALVQDFKEARYRLDDYLETAYFHAESGDPRYVRRLATSVRITGNRVTSQPLLRRNRRD